MTASRQRLAYLLCCHSLLPRSHCIIVSSGIISRLHLNIKPNQAFLHHKMSASSSASSFDDANLSKQVEELTSLIQQAGQPSKKKWWENYLKHELEFYGAPMADICSCLVASLTTKLQHFQQNYGHWHGACFVNPLPNKSLLVYQSCKNTCFPKRKWWPSETFCPNSKHSFSQSHMTIGALPIGFVWGC